jgi:hypothetical protein
MPRWSGLGLTLRQVPGDRPLPEGSLAHPRRFPPPQKNKQLRVDIQNEGGRPLMSVPLLFSFDRRLYFMAAHPLVKIPVLLPVRMPIMDPLAHWLPPLVTDWGRFEDWVDGF